MQNKRIQVLGPGCPKCSQLQENAEMAVRQLGIKATVERITDMETIIELGALLTPALVIDGRVRAVGLVSSEEIKRLLAK
ncbi:MAG: thioredoxin family protein [Thermoguttaceae bacterium]|jgi:small redox-active disulfide protein 2